MISHLACSEGADLFATAAFEKTVSVWSLAERQRVATFDTILDFGGVRLAMTGGEHPRILAGAYHVEGLACYEAREGRLLWQRKDLKRVQHVAVCESLGLAAVGRERGALQVLEIETGETRLIPRGAKEAVIDDQGVLLLGKNTLAMAELDGRLRWRRKVDGWGMLMAALGPGGALVSVQGRNQNVCFDRETGEEKWAYGNSGLVFHQAEWCARDGCWRGAECKPGHWWQIVELDETGHRREVYGRMTAVRVMFMHRGTKLLTSDGQILSLPSRESEWRFAEQHPHF